MKIADAMKLYGLGLSNKMRQHRDSLRERLRKFEGRMGPAAEFRNQLTRNKGAAPGQDGIPPSTLTQSNTSPF